MPEGGKVGGLRDERPVHEGPRLLHELQLPVHEHRIGRRRKKKVRHDLQPSRRSPPTAPHAPHSRRRRCVVHDHEPPGREGSLSVLRVERGCGAGARHKNEAVGRSRSSGVVSVAVSSSTSSSSAVAVHLLEHRGGQPVAWVRELHGARVEDGGVDHDLAARRRLGRRRGQRQLRLHERADDRVRT